MSNYAETSKKLVQRNASKINDNIVVPHFGISYKKELHFVTND